MRAYGSRFRVEGLEFRVEDLGSRLVQFAGLLDLPESGAVECLLFTVVIIKDTLTDLCGN